MKAARAILGEHENDIDRLKEAESWLFAGAPAKAQGDRTGLPNAGTSSDEGKTMRRWRKLAGLDDSDEKWEAGPCPTASHSQRTTFPSSTRYTSARASPACSIEAGAELIRTQVAPEADAFTFAQIAGHTGVTVETENLSGVTSANQMFTSCGSLETIYATSFSNTGLSGSLMFNSCNRLVGGTDGFVPSTTSSASVCKLGAGGVLTDPNNDNRTWFWAHYYANGEGVLTASSAPDPTRELVTSGRICAIGKYVDLGFTPWDDVTGLTRRQHLTSATFATGRERSWTMSTAMFSARNLTLNGSNGQYTNRAGASAGLVQTGILAGPTRRSVGPSRPKGYALNC